MSIDPHKSPKDLEEFTKARLDRPETIRAAVMGFLLEKKDAHHQLDAMPACTIRAGMLLMWHALLMGEREAGEKCGLDGKYSSPYGPFRIMLLHLADLVIGIDYDPRGHGEMQFDKDFAELSERVRAEEDGLLNNELDDLLKEED